MIAGKDAWIEQDDDDNHGNDGELHVKKHATVAYRTLLHFDLTAQIGNIITDATFKAYIKSGENQDVTINIYRLTRHWEEGTGGGEYAGSASGYCEHGVSGER